MKLIRLNWFAYSIHMQSEITKSNGFFFIENKHDALTDKF